MTAAIQLYPNKSWSLLVSLVDRTERERERERERVRQFTEREAAKGLENAFAGSFVELVEVQVGVVVVVERVECVRDRGFE
jgi:hypothetical protein